jgi:L-alanine-DL-glutamate epimerase-like enolase superfamily enzyme
VKITNIRLQRLRAELDPPFYAAWDPVPRKAFTATLVSVETDEGITGVGSGDTMDGFEPFVDLFVGQDPLQIARHVRTLETISYHSGRFWPLEAAFWDIAGQACGRPVSFFFGGFGDRIPAYASCGELKDPEARAESALALREEGFRALKIRVQPQDLKAGIAAVAAVREAVGGDMDILVDLNQAWRMPGDISPYLDFSTVGRVAAELRELDVFWLEEPLPLDDTRGFHDLRRLARGMRLAGGEMARTLEEMLGYLAADTLDVYQPDVVLSGMSRTRVLAELALARNRWFSPHTWTNGLGLLANLHVTAGVGGGPYLEFPYDPPGWTVERRDFFLAEPVRIDSGGCVCVPPHPGLGAIIDGEKVKLYQV